MTKKSGRSRCSEGARPLPQLFFFFFPASAAAAFAFERVSHQASNPTTHRSMANMPNIGRYKHMPWSGLGSCAVHGLIQCSSTMRKSGSVSSKPSLALAAIATHRRVSRSMCPLTQNRQVCAVSLNSLTVGSPRSSAAPKPAAPRLSLSSTSAARAMTPAPNTAPPKQVTEDISQNKRRGSMDRRWSIDQPATPPRTAEQPVGTGSVAMRIGERPHTTVESINEEEDARPLMLAPDSEAVLVNEGTMPDPNSDPMLRVLRKPPDLRTEEDLIVVANATKTVKFFRQMGDAALHRELCRHMTLEQVPKESVIFQQGDEGSTFYIIYTGAVKVRGATHL